MEKKLSGNDKHCCTTYWKTGLDEGVSAAPQGVPQRNRQTGQSAGAKDHTNPFRLQEVNYVMYHPLELPVVARKITDRLSGAFDQTHHDLGGLLQTAMDELDMAYVAAKPQ